MIRLLLADDHPIVREGLKRIVSEFQDMEVVSEVDNGDDLLAEVESSKADVILLDISMPGPGFFKLMDQLKAKRGNCKILILSMQPEKMYAVRALRSGASGYLTKDHSPSELGAAIRRVYQGGRYISQTLAETLALGLEEDSDTLPHEDLSNREYQVLCMLGAGKRAKEIAAHLHLSPKTVSTYRARLLEKMDLETTADLIRYAIKNNLVP
ncbi:MAG: response regulator transcription factor [Thermoanaerobaculia bacterium]